MGVYKLGSSFLGKIKGKGRSKPIKFLPVINHYFIDVNGILHPVAQKVFAYRSGDFDKKDNKEEYYARVEEIDGKNWKDLMGEYSDALMKVFDDLFDVVNPTSTFALCVDGIAPAAKIAQQRNRRLGGSSNISFEFEKLDIRRAEVGFSNTMITPGTEFMQMVDEIISTWLIKKKRENQRVKFIYSSHLIDGEGEHKIFNIIEQQKIGKYEDTYGIEGVDSDMISLTVLRQKHFVLIRSERNNFIDMNEFKRFIWDSMGTYEKKFNKGLVLKDFVLLLYLVGNDFLPRFLFVEDVGESIFNMMECYKTNTIIPLTTYLDTIDWNSFSNFLNCLTVIEKKTSIEED